MRILVLLVVACGTAPPPPSAPPPPAAYLARVGITGQSWTDFVIDGTGSASRALCDVLVASEQRMLAKVATSGVYTRPCALEPLAAPQVTTPYVLVDSRRVDQDTVLIDLMIDGRREPLQPAHGTRTTRVPLADRKTCEAARATVDADDKASNDAMVIATRDFLAQQLQEATQREQEACGRVRDDDRRCANLPPDAAAACLHAFDDERRRCGDAAAQRDVIEKKQHARPPSAPAVTRSCEPASR